MSSFAHITGETVDAVIVIDAATLTAANGWYCPSCGAHKPLSEWVETDEDTVEGTHKKGGTPLRKNYAGIGMKYDAVRDIFIPPKGSPKFTFFNEERGVWEHPTKKQPKDGFEWVWSEEDEDWVKRQT